MKTYKSVLCVAPFSSLTIMQQGKLYPCCAWENNANYKFNLGVMLNQNSSIDYNFNKTNFIVRNDFLKNPTVPIENCKTCISIRRQNELHNSEANPEIDYITTPTLTNLHLKISNLCNLACRMCDPNSSNLLAKEHDKFISVREDKKKYELSSLEIGTPAFQSILDNIQNLKFIWFSGGEPLINPTVWAILEHGYNTGCSKDIKLQFNTNGTFKLKDHHLKILKSYKHIDMHVSMDGLKEHAEYIRTNLVWEDWVKEFKVYYENFSRNAGNTNSELQINLTVSVFNVHILDQIEQFFNTFDSRGHVPIIYGYALYPENLSIKNLNQVSKDYLLKKYSIPNLIKQQSTLIDVILQTPVINPISIKTYIDLMDDKAIAKNLYKKYTPFREVDPKWYNVISGRGDWI